MDAVLDGVRFVRSVSKHNTAVDSVVIVALRRLACLDQADTYPASAKRAATGPPPRPSR